MPGTQAQQYDVIGVRGVMGFFFEALEQYDGMAWIQGICNTFESNQDVETYAGIGMVPQLREWIGGKQAQAFNEMSVKITNKDFEATIAIKNKDRRRDKTGQLRARMGDLALRAIAHDALLVSGLINGGTSTSITIPGMAPQTIACYDGQPFFSASHKIGSQALNNIVTVTLSSLPQATQLGVGTTTAPSIYAMATAIINGVKALYGFLDDKGQPLNELARKFQVQVPIALSDVALAARNSAYLGLGGAPNPLQFVRNPASQEIEVEIIPNPRLTWTNQIAVFRADAAFKPIIRQVEVLDNSSAAETQSGEQDSLPAGHGIIMKAKAEGSDFEFDNNAVQFSVEKSGNVGFGRFDQAALVQFA